MTKDQEKAELRRILSKQAPKETMDEYLARGGKITKIEPEKFDFDILNPVGISGRQHKGGGLRG